MVKNGVDNAAANVSGRKGVSTVAQPQLTQLQAAQAQDASMCSQRDTGLQKSLPNLISGSKSEFNLPAPSFPVDTASEKGSYGDIPSVLNPSGRSQATTSSTTRLAGSASKLPTPARSRLPTPAKSGIPTPRNGRTLPVPGLAAKQRMNSKSPAPNPSASNVPRTRTEENWKDGCF